MPPKYVKFSNIQQYSQEEIQTAIYSIKQGISVRQASHNFNIPYSTLQRHSTNEEESFGSGRQTVFTAEEENHLFHAITVLEEILTTETFVKEIHEKLLSSEFINNLCRSIVESDIFIQTIATLVDNKLNVYETKLSVLEEENKQLKSHIHSIQAKVNDMDQYSKRKDVIITGIPQTPEEDTTKLVINLAKEIGFDLNVKDIYASHRLPSKSQPKPNIVGFLRYTDRTELLKRRRQLKDVNGYQKVYINEHLTKL
ncbi:unnamed protein product, partial [Didymodactylos carnosus]